MSVAGRAAMTWEAGRTRWKIRSKKVADVVSCKALGMPPNKLESYRAANASWAAKKDEIDAQAPTHPRTPALDQLARRREWV